jgi:hypothetical protein
LQNKNIAARLEVMEAAVRYHLTAIFAKLGIADRFVLALYAYQHGLATPPFSAGTTRRATLDMGGAWVWSPSAP